MYLNLIKGESKKKKTRRTIKNRAEKTERLLKRANTQIEILKEKKRLQVEQAWEESRHSQKHETQKHVTKVPWTAETPRPLNSKEQSGWQFFDKTESHRNDNFSPPNSLQKFSSSVVPPSSFQNPTEKWQGNVSSQILTKWSNTTRLGYSNAPVTKYYSESFKGTDWSVDNTVVHEEW